MRIVIVDDNKDSAKALAFLLEQEHHDVCVACDASTAMEVVRTFEPKVVVMDLGLPGISGLELAERLRRDCGGADLRFIAVTGYGDDETRRRSLEAGFEGHLLKPVDIDTLLGQLQAIDGASPAT